MKIYLQPAVELPVLGSYDVGGSKIGVGIWIEPCCVLRRVFMNGIASLPEFRQHHDDAVEQLPFDPDSDSDPDPDFASASTS